MHTLLKTDWDFKGFNTQYMTHGFHLYPARMIPQIASTLIKHFSYKGDTIYDPFCGSGTVLVESLLHGRHSIGTDLNPLALLISKVKTTPINPSILLKTWHEINEKIREDFKNYNLKQFKPTISKLAENTNINFWFKDYVIDGLSIIRNRLEKILSKEKEEIKNFFLVCFSATVRKVSNLRNGEYKLYRISPDKLRSFNPNVYLTFKNIINTNINKMREFYNYIKDNNRRNIKVKVIGPIDTRFIPEKIIKNNSIDLIVTSPPYGDSRTTVGYGQFSRYSLIWLGFGKEEVYNIDANLLGGKKAKRNGLKSRTAKKIIEEISKRDKKRAEDTEAFLVDLNETLKQMYRVLKKGSHACIVIGNRTVRRVKVPSSTITKELGEILGFEHVITIGRNIPAKSIPTKSKFKLENGEVTWIRTINKEDIVILRKR